MSMSLCVGVLCCLLLLVDCANSAQQEKLAVAVSNVRRDTIDAPVTVDMGQVPDWLNGTFIRHSCGAFGETGSKAPIVNRINHLFDCIEMASSFQFNDGSTTFYNRYYDTRKTEIWRNYDMNMNESRVYWRTALADFDYEQTQRLAENFSRPGKVSETGHISWWLIGDRPANWGEGINGNLTGFAGVWIDVHRAEVISEYPFKDTILGYPAGTVFINTPAHSHREPDGTVWSTSGVYTRGSTPRYWHPKITLYHVEDDYRRVKTEVPYTQIDVLRCVGGNPYPDLSARPGYMHSFSMTENYIILPVSSYLMDPCLLAQQGRPTVPFFTASFQWYDEHPSFLYVIRKQDGQLVANISTHAFFVTHQLNSYESEGLMHLDMLVYPNSSIYDVHTFVDNMLADLEYPTYVERFTVRMSDWSLVERTQLRNMYPDPVEMSNINPLYLTKPYQYAYMGHRVYLTQNSVIKLNVNTKEEVSYALGDEQFIQEPIFVPRPNPTAEDDGVLLVQGIDANLKKGFLLVLDAKTMQPVAHATAPDLMLFGLHNAYFPNRGGQDPETSGVPLQSPMLTMAIIFVLVALSTMDV